MRLSAVAALCLLFLPMAQAKAEATAGAFHPECPAAFAALPIEGGRIVDRTAGATRLVEQAEMPEHFAKYEKEYLAFDRLCMVPWDDLKPNSRDFLGPNVGIIVSFDGGKFLPKCTAFRVASNLIATAHHCPILLSTFRLLGAPDIAIPIAEAPVALGHSPDSTAPDLDDWAVYRIADPPLAYTWTPATFNGEILDNNAAYIVTVSEFAWERLVNKDLTRWREAVRFSRINGGKLWPPVEAAPELATDELIGRCLFHRIPTYAMMSGAPIIALRRFDNGATIKLYVAGIHLRNGAIELSDDHQRSCGTHDDFNIGVRLAPDLLKIASQD